MSRQDEYDAFMAQAHTRPELLAKVTEARDQARKQLLLARLKTSYTDYSPARMGASYLRSGKVADDSDTVGGVTIRAGWVRWQELAARLDTVDAWIASPDWSAAGSVLREAMVSVPDAIDDELDDWGKVKRGMTNAAEHAIESAGPPLGALALVGLAVYWAVNRK